MVCGFLLFSFLSASAQQKNASTGVVQYDYYLNLKGVNDRHAVEIVESLIKSKPNVQFFQAKRYPPLYFNLKSTVPISEQQLKSWLANSSFTIVHFGEGTFGKEKAIMTGRKSLKP